MLYHIIDEIFNGNYNDVKKTLYLFFISIIITMGILLLFKPEI
jgi:hypothetical protein